jgi:hypothetical protein
MAELAECLRSLAVDPASPACHDVVAALAEALIDTCFDVYALDVDDPDAAIRAALRAVHGTLSSLHFDCPVEAYGAVAQAVNEIGVIGQMAACA